MYLRRLIKKNFSESRGVALYLAIVILSVMSTVLFSLIGILLSQTRVVFGIGNSTVAFYAADTGIEKVLYDIYRNGRDPLDDKGEIIYPVSGDANDFEVLQGEIGYQVQISPDWGDGGAGDDKIWSTGDFRGTRRKLEITF